MDDKQLLKSILFYELANGKRNIDRTCLVGKFQVKNRKTLVADRITWYPAILKRLNAFEASRIQDLDQNLIQVDETRPS